MDMNRFNELVNGPLGHPIPLFAITRLVGALWHLLNQTGERGEKALEAYCRLQEESDRIKGGEHPDFSEN
jgi:hypothetical protein